MSLAWKRRAFMNNRQISVVLFAGGLVASCAAKEPPTLSQIHPPGQSDFNRFVESNCLDCHSKTDRTAGLAVDELINAGIGRNQPAWEKIIRKLSARQMPPIDAPRPNEKEYKAAINWLELSIDGAAAANPNPGRTE